jgi:rfaE bifunctional protein kinase chain/domain
MNLEPIRAAFDRYPRLRVAVLGDFCLDRYLEIDPARAETSIETGLPVHNVVRVRAQAGAAGTVLNNLAALGIGTLFPIGCCGDDGEGFELRRALAALPGVDLTGFVTAPDRRTFTYCKPLVIEPGRPPRELSRLDSKNWDPTPEPLGRTLADHLTRVAAEVDAVIVLDQVDVAETGVVTRQVLAAVGAVAADRPALRVVGDSRRGLAGWPAMTFKMNGAEAALLAGRAAPPDVPAARDTARSLAARSGRDVVITLAERGLVGAEPGGSSWHVPARPVRGPIDIVGAGDAVTANLTAALATGLPLSAALEVAAAAASVVIHQLGTTGTASREQILAELAVQGPTQ